MTADRPRHRGRTTEPVALTRRRLIVGSGLAASLTAIGAEHGVPATGPWALANWNDDNPVHDELLEVFRTDDAMVLRFRLINMKVYKPPLQEAYLRTLEPTRPRILIVDFPPQSVGEQTYDSTSISNISYDPVPTGQDTSGNRSRAFLTPIPTRLVFEIPAEFTTLRPALEGTETRPGLLEWNRFAAVTGPLIEGGVPYTAPTETQTSIGAPYGLSLATTEKDGWVHSTAPVTLEGRTELWQTRLGATRDKDGRAIPLSEYPAAAPEVRAVWSTGFDRTANQIPSDTDGYQIPLSAPDRRAIVRLTSDNMTTGFEPAPIEARRLMLTSSGASLELHGAWTPPSQVFPDRVPDPSGQQPSGINLSSWIHHSTLGRDNHVVVTYLGYLLPFGHPVALIKETQRRFEANPTKSPVAYLRTRRYIIIRKHDKHYGAGSPTKWHAFDGRDFPFRRVRINTLATPNLTFQRYEDPVTHAAISGTAFCLAGGKPFPFSVTAWDWEGTPVTFTVPMAFVTASTAFNPTGANVAPHNDQDLGNENNSMQAVIAGWTGLAATSPLRTAQLGGHSIALADSRSGKGGETSLRFASMSFGLTVPDPGGDDASWQALDQPRANPTLSSGLARIPAVQAVSPGATSTVFYDDSYVEEGFVLRPDPNDDSTWTTPDAMSVFLQVTGQKLRFSQGGAVSSLPGSHPGVITPDLSVGGISRNRGVVGGVHNGLGNGGVDRFKAGTFDPRAFLDGAKLLGGLDLADIIETVAHSTEHAPDIKTIQSGATSEPSLETTLRWNPSLQADPANVFKPKAGARLSLDATFVTPSAGQPPTSEVSGVLRNFELNMFGGASFLTLSFNELSFHSRNGAKPTVKCDISTVTFGDELSFLNPLEQFLSFGGNGPSVVVRPDSVTAGISLALPSIGIGVFSLTNLSFTAAVEIPFTGAPARLRFGFASRERPFHVAVLIFSGGGWFDLAVGTDGVERMEIGLEFGGQFELDLVVASAGIEVMAGMYFSIEAGQGKAQGVRLVGYFKAHGELNVGPAGASFTFTMGLTYDDAGGGADPRVWGEVDVSVEVHVLMIGGSIDFHFSKEFAGGGDPTFADMLTNDDYVLYAGAFA